MIAPADASRRMNTQSLVIRRRIVRIYALLPHSRQRIWPEVPGAHPRGAGGRLAAKILAAAHAQPARAAPPPRPPDGNAAARSSGDPGSGVRKSSSPRNWRLRTGTTNLPVSSGPFRTPKQNPCRKTCLMRFDLHGAAPKSRPKIMNDAFRGLWHGGRQLHQDIHLATQRTSRAECQGRSFESSRVQRAARVSKRCASPAPSRSRLVRGAAQ